MNKENVEVDRSTELAMLREVGRRCSGGGGVKQVGAKIVIYRMQ